MYRALLLWERPAWSLLLALPLYAFFSLQLTQLSSFGSSKVPYFNYLADALLHGQLDLRLIPPLTHDLALFGGKYFLYWPPLPALLLVPFVGAFGVSFSDILFTLVVASLNVLVVAHFLRRACALKIIKLSKMQRACLVLFFALGTVHVTLAPYGRIWSTSQLVGFFFVALAYLCAVTLAGRRAFLCTGAALAAALLTRNHLVLAGIWPAYYLIRREAKAPPHALIDVAAGAAPVLAGVALLGVYNYLRFGSVLENGLSYHLPAREFVADFERYGLFSLHYLPTNLFYQYVAYPLPLHATTFYGGSLFLLSPVFIAAFWGIFRGRPRWSIGTLMLSIVALEAPILTLMGTGWVQFGPRYTLDFTLPLLLLTAMGIRRWPGWVLVSLTIVSVVQYVLGTAYFGAYLVLLNNL